MESVLKMAAKTAIHRNKPSIPARVAVQVCTSKNIFDYGCGRGRDVAYYKELGFDAGGWDPYYNPTALLPSGGQYSFITCIFVLNVLPLHERTHCMYQIHNLLPSGGNAMFAVRSHKEISDAAKKGTWEPRTDGWVTGKNTFQKGFTPDELMHVAGGMFQTVELLRTNPVIVLATKI